MVKTVRGHTSELTLRPATVDDAVSVADLDALHDPGDARDPAVLRHWWSTMSRVEITNRQIGERDGVPVAFVAAAHARWESTPLRFGAGRVVIHPGHWSPGLHLHLIEVAEKWLRSERCDTAIMRAREDFAREVDVLLRHGYREARRARVWELDLGVGRERLLAQAEHERAKMREQGVQMLVLSEDTDPLKLPKLYDVTAESEQDIPTTAPFRKLGFEDWRQHWFENPGIRQDRFWIAREGGDIIGMSVLEFPSVRNVPWTAYTGTARRVRGRGVARALKYQTLAQAIAMGYPAVRTQNDGANAPILHLNEEMGYRPIAPILELHRRLTG